MWLDLVKILAGMVLLVGGADVLVRGASSMARALGVSALVIGLTVVAFGTSAPELFVSLVAALRGTADVAVGNVIGSNLFNILMIIGIAAILSPVEISRAVSRWEMPIMLSTLGLFWIVALNGLISRWEGILLFILIIFYLLHAYRSMQRSRVLKSAVEREVAMQEAEYPLWKSWLMVGGGLVGLLFGAEWVVSGATVVARDFGVSELVIGTTLVAVGTSLPELATAFIAALRKEPELCVGNAIGSNIFNVLCVIGATATVAPLNVVQSALDFDLIYMFIACFAVWPVMLARASLGRVVGTLMLLTYAAYIYLVLQSYGG